MKEKLGRHNWKWKQQSNSQESITKNQLFYLVIEEEMTLLKDGRKSCFSH